MNQNKKQQNENENKPKKTAAPGSFSVQFKSVALYAPLAIYKRLEIYLLT